MNIENKLYIIPTPLGNLNDITFRALEILGKVSLVLSEDTRMAHKLFSAFNIQNKVASYHQNNEHKVVESFINKLKEGMSLALITDAGTPAISDPGYLLVRRCIDENILVEVLPGATAFVPALVGSGFPLHRFVYEGFLPQQKGRQTKIKAIFEQNTTVVFYESPHRIVKFLEQSIALGFAEREICIVRELTKIFETYHRGTVQELFSYFSQNTPKGEIVVVVK
jgi:16S rRNA (cytidine1402-2'-O)-methyltransferase